MNEKDDRLIQKTKAEFDRSVEQIDAETASRITQARYRVLEKAKKNNWTISTWLPLSGIATACLAVMVFFAMPDQTQDPNMTEDDLDLISTTEEIELYEELEFYQWLEDYELPS